MCAKSRRHPHGLETSGKGAVGLDQDVLGGGERGVSGEGHRLDHEGPGLPHLGLGVTQQMMLEAEGLGLEAKMPCVMPDDTKGV